MNSQYLYHYTNLNTLMKVIETGILWATDYRFLNDSSELDYAIKTIKNHAIDLDADHTLFSETLASYGIGDSETFLTTVSKLSSIDVLPAFITSFSEKGDLLSQWRGYSQFGQGVSIEFDREKLSESFYKNDNPMFSKFGKCLYDVRTVHEQFQTKAIATMANLHKTPDLEYLHNFIFSQWLPFIKNPAFEEEIEWRAVIFKPANWQVFYRMGVYSLIPYYEIKLPDISQLITKVILGPTPHPELSRISLESFLHKFNPRIQVQQSKIPFRG